MKHFWPLALFAGIPLSILCCAVFVAVRSNPPLRTISEFVPELPARLGQSWVFTSGSESNATVLTFSPLPPQNITIAKSYINCLYIDDKRVKFVVYANGKRERVRCSNE